MNINDINCKINTNISSNNTIQDSNIFTKSKQNKESINSYIQNDNILNNIK